MKKFVALFLALIITSYICPPAFSGDYAYPLIESEAAVLMDAQTGQVLFAKNMHEQLSPASITKIMTILLGIEHGKLNDTLTMSREAVFSIEFGSSHIALDTGEQITLEQALMATMLASANEAANGIAEYVSGSVPEFAELMNQRAREAGALHTNFVNPNGLYADQHLTTAYDMAVISRAALQNQDFRRVFASVKYEIPPTNKQPQTRYLWAEHKMFPGYRYQYDGMLGGKTGYTVKSQNTLVTSARRGDRELIAVVMKSMNSAVYTDTRALLDYGFNDFVPVPVTLPLLAEANLTEPAQGSIKALQTVVKQAQGTANTRLIHRSLGPQDIKVDYTCIQDLEGSDPQLRVNIYLQKPSTYMYGDLGAFTLGASPPVSETIWRKMLHIAWLIIKILAASIVVLVLLLLSLKAYFTLRRKRRRNRSRSPNGLPAEKRYNYE